MALNYDSKFSLDRFDWEECQLLEYYGLYFGMKVSKHYS